MTELNVVVQGHFCCSYCVYKILSKILMYHPNIGTSNVSQCSYSTLNHPLAWHSPVAQPHPLVQHPPLTQHPYKVTSIRAEHEQANPRLGLLPFILFYFILFLFVCVCVLCIIIIFFFFVYVCMYFYVDQGQGVARDFAKIRLGWSAMGRNLRVYGGIDPVREILFTICLDIQ
jgi:hypothetical protein